MNTQFNMSPLGSSEAVSNPVVQHVSIWHWAVADVTPQLSDEGIKGDCHMYSKDALRSEIISEMWYHHVSGVWKQLGLCLKWQPSVNCHTSHRLINVMRPVYHVSTHKHISLMQRAAVCHRAESWSATLVRCVNHDSHMGACRRSLVWLYWGCKADQWFWVHRCIKCPSVRFCLREEAVIISCIH